MAPPPQIPFVRLEDDEDAHPDEPDAFDPHSLGPETPGADGETPGPDPPSVDFDPTEVDVPADLARAFWAAVVLANVGLLAGSLAVLVAVFEGRYRLAAVLGAVGVVGFAGTYRIYRARVGGEAA